MFVPAAKVELEGNHRGKGFEPVELYEADEFGTPMFE